MQYALPFERATRLAEVHWRLRAFYGPPPEAWRPDPVSQLVLSMMGVRTRGEVSSRAFERLAIRFKSWDSLAGASTGEIAELIAGVTRAEHQAGLLSRALQAIIARHGRLELDFLAGWPVEDALSWLRRLPGVGPKVAAAVLNFSTLGRRALVVDTHHWRASRRLGLIPPKTALDRTPKLLTRQLPDAWSAGEVETHHLLMKRLGQDVCHHAATECGRCPLRPMCPVAVRLLARPLMGRAGRRVPESNVLHGRRA